LLKAIVSDNPTLLLIAEIDRADAEFEAFLLEVLSDFQVSVPELGTLKAKHMPLVILTSNNTRELSKALKRRCLYVATAASFYGKIRGRFRRRGVFVLRRAYDTKTCCDFRVHIRKRSGAVSDAGLKVGRADNGTIFLDEIGEMTPEMQTRLLRVLQERTFEALGSEEPVHVDVRVIAATNVDLEEAIEKKRFRADLYHRLNVLEIRVPPLRERTVDIPLLTAHFLRKFGTPRGVSGIRAGCDASADRPPVAGKHPGIGECDRVGRG
jgi:MoxR-like ATPase